MSGKRYPTKLRLWLSCSVIIYALFMLLWPSVMPLGWMWLQLLSHLSHPDTPHWFVILVVPFWIASLVIGWVLHALVLVGTSLRHDAKPIQELPTEPGGS